MREQGDTLILRAHLARANPQWKALAAGDEALVIFQALEHYISPSWYATKAETHKVVPTWNYIIVQARGPVSVQDAADWKHAQVDALTSEHEQGRAEPWASVTHRSPSGGADRGIVGIEMTVTLAPPARRSTARTARKPIVRASSPGLRANAIRQVRPWRT